MKPIIYYVAASLDGFISKKDDDVSCFPHDEKLIAHYFDQLKKFETVIMGKNTYEVGYKFGLAPGKKAYPHMEHYIFSKSIQLPEGSEVNQVSKNWRDKIIELKSISRTPIYLCGGTQFAGWLSSENLIDEIWIKLNPFVLGDGKGLFGFDRYFKLKHLEQKIFESGIIEIKYRVIHEKI